VGIWIGFDVMCGVGLAAGGFTLVAMVHIFNIEKYKPDSAPGHPDRVPGLLLVVVGCFTISAGPTAVASAGDVESALGDVRSGLVRDALHHRAVPGIPPGGASRSFGLHKPLEWIHRISVPLMILGVLLSTLHQSSLGTLFLIVPEKLYPLWYTPILPLLFYVSAIAVGLAMTIFESWHSSRAFGRALELPLLMSMARVLAVVMSVYLWIRFLDLQHRHAFGCCCGTAPRPGCSLLEIALAVVPTVLLYQRASAEPGRLYACAVMVVFGFIANRLNVGTPAWKPAPARTTSRVERGSGDAVDHGRGLCDFPRDRAILPHF
jgi:Ni/Fe-hydrogenase subunit HybB-like protein